MWITYCTKLITDCFCAFDVKPKADEDPYMLLADKVSFSPFFFNEIGFW